MATRYERQARLTDNFSQVPHGLWTTDLSWGAKCLLGWLHSHRPEYVDTLTNQRIRRELGCSGIVTKWFDELESHGFIRVMRDGKRQRVTILAAPWEALACRKMDQSQNGHEELSEDSSVKKRSMIGQETVDDRSGNDHIEDHVEHQVEDHPTHTREIVQEAEIVSDEESSFVRFWKAYPRGEGKQPARRAWRKMTQADRDAALDALPDHLRRWVTQGTEKQYIPHASTWLNGRRWEDELTTDYQPQGSIVQRAARFALEAQARRDHDRIRSDGSPRAIGRDDDRMDRRVDHELLPGSHDVRRSRGSDDGGNPFDADMD